tara:strand:+ start:137 stop:577 length:441 start_codon:yes stop_codon:yes gene_type:complete
MSKLGEDNYKRPKKTYTDKLTDDDIKAKLEDYVEVDDISMVPLNSHVRYFTEKINEKKKKEKVFRLGGFLVNKSNYEKYVILSNVPETGFINPIKKTWSVNTKTSIFYKKQTLDEIKEEYELEIEDLKDQIKFLKKEIKKLKSKKG